jgi:outer membrane protein OmpA-like peptidoglycan-associated protein
MRLLSVFIFFLLTLSSAAQNCKLPKNKELNDKFNDAKALMQQNKDVSVRFLSEIAKSNPNYFPATLILGNYNLEKAKDAALRFQSKLSLEYAKTAIDYLNLSYGSCNNYDSCRAAYLLGESYYISRNYEKSKFFFQFFLSSENAAPSCLKAAKNRMKMIEEYFRLINNPIEFDPKMLKNVSTKDDEFLPLISHDGSILLYSRRSEKRPGEFVEELMMSTRTEAENGDGEFSKGIRMSSPFNTGKIQGGTSLTIDNRVMYITICNHDNCDIYYSKNIKGAWQPLIKLPNTVNTEYFEGQPTVDATSNVLYFSSNRPGGFGGYDIYKIVRKHQDSLWSAPINLGADINTEFDEKTPFIHCDGKTLYFSSNGHGGVGGFDIFYSQIDGSGKFTKPQNIGYPLNTQKDEVAYIVSADGKRIYFSSMLLSGEGGWDIYCSALSENAAPNQVILIKGKITDEDGKPVSDVNVDLTGLRSYETSHSVTDSKTGEYAVTASVDKDEEYMLTVKKKGFFYNVQFFQPDSGNLVPPTIENVRLDKIKTNVPYALENVNFDFNSAKLTETGKAYLHQLSMFFDEYPQYDIEILGHTDAIGSEEDNMVLSERRCRTVINFLITAGIDSKRLTYKAFGKSAPMTTNETSEGRALNRRVEFVLSVRKK